MSAARRLPDFAIGNHQFGWWSCDKGLCGSGWPYPHPLSRCGGLIHLQDLPLDGPGGALSCFSRCDACGAVWDGEGRWIFDPTIPAPRGWRPAAVRA